MDSPCKYYFSDIGLRNTQIDFRQIEPSHIMENIIYNELLVRGFNVDVGVVTISSTDDNNKRVRKQHEVDFVCNKGNRCYYIQSAFRMLDQDKIKQETTSLLGIENNFKKIIITVDQGLVGRDNNGITYLSLLEFLQNPNSLEL